VSPILRHSLTISLTYSLSSQVQGKHSVETIGVIEQWEGVTEELAVNKLALIQCSIVLVSPIPLSAADRYAGLGNKQLYLINCYRDLCILSPVKILHSGRQKGKKRQAITTIMNSSLVYCTNNLLQFRLVSTGGHLLILLLS